MLCMTWYTLLFTCPLQWQCLQWLSSYRAVHISDVTEVPGNRRGYPQVVTVGCSLSPIRSTPEDSLAHISDDFSVKNINTSIHMFTKITHFIIYHLNGDLNIVDVFFKRLVYQVLMTERERYRTRLKTV